MYKIVQVDKNSGEPTMVQNLNTNSYIPFEPTNSDYQKYLKWLDGYELQGREWVKTSDGNTPEPADE